jgi:excisionase family DNA binding protein
MGKQDEGYLTPGQVAKMLMVSPAAVRLWAEKGEIKALTTPGGHRRFLHSEVKRFSLDRGLVPKNISKMLLSVLIVDDDIQFANYLQKLLSKFPDLIEVDVASNGFDAGVKVREYDPDVVLFDLMMPGLDGFSVCKRLKSSSSTENIRMIAMTGYPSTENVEKILSAGAEVCLSKPVEKNEILRLLGINVD